MSNQVAVTSLEVAMHKLPAVFHAGHSQPGSPDSLVSLGWPQFAILMVLVLAILLLAGFAGMPW